MAGACWRMCWPAGAPYGTTTSLLGPGHWRSGPPVTITHSDDCVSAAHPGDRCDRSDGGTGRHVAAELLKRGLPVRALVRRIDERSEALQAMGIHVVVGDFADYASLLAALESVEAAYFSYPVGAGLTEAAGLFAAAGRERDLQLVVGPSSQGFMLVSRKLPQVNR